MPAERRFYRAARVANGPIDGWLPDHAVGVADGKIIDVLPAADAPGEEVVDLGDVSLLPGLVEGHTHHSLSAARGCVRHHLG